MKRLFWVAALLVLLGLGFLLTRSESGDVAVVEIEGGIFEPDPVVRQLEELRKDPGVQAVILRIDSSGGSVGASQEIHEAVRELAKEKKVVASLGAVAASGGYYVALPANVIIANAGTVTGSIGVRMEYLYVEDLIRWARLKAETLKSGRWKDAGSPVRPMTEDERNYLEAILRKMHVQFKTAVAEARRLSPDTVDQWGEGQIFTGEEAKSVGLVDELGNFQTAVRKAQELAGIKGEPDLYYPRRRYEGWLERFLGEASTRFVREIGRPRIEFHY